MPLLTSTTTAQTKFISLSFFKFFYFSRISISRLVLMSRSLNLDKTFRNETIYSLRFYMNERRRKKKQNKMAEEKLERKKGIVNFDAWKDCFFSSKEDGSKRFHIVSTVPNMAPHQTLHPIGDAFFSSSSIIGEIKTGTASRSLMLSSLISFSFHTCVCVCVFQMTALVRRD